MIRKCSQFRYRFDCINQGSFKGKSGHNAASAVSQGWQYLDTEKFGQKTAIGVRDAL